MATIQSIKELERQCAAIDSLHSLNVSSFEQGFGAWLGDTARALLNFFEKDDVCLEKFLNINCPRFGRTINVTDAKYEIECRYTINQTLKDAYAILSPLILDVRRKWPLKYYCAKCSILFENTVVKIWKSVKAVFFTILRCIQGHA